MGGRSISLGVNCGRVAFPFLSLLKNMFGLGSERPPMASGNSLLVEWRLGRGCDLAILVGLRMP